MSDLSRRIDRLEVGGRGNELETAVTEVTETVAANGFSTQRFELAFDDANITQNPKGLFYFSAYLDTVSANSRWPIGDDGTGNYILMRINWWYEKTPIDADNSKSYVKLYIGNLDSSNSHDIIIRSRWLYVAGSAGTTAS